MNKKKRINLTCGTFPLLVLLLMVASCTVFTSSLERIRRGAIAQGFNEECYSTSKFDIVGFSRQSQSDKNLVVYLEGDGLAWRTRYEPSLDPTPLLSTCFQLAVLDPSPSVAYIARPGQYVGGVGGRNCEISLWTSGRYSKRVVIAMDEAISLAKARAGAHYVHLVGYSGGGAIALLVAAMRHDVLSIRTVAGNLNHEAWTKLHRVTPLWGSINPYDQIEALSGITQVHYVGTKDNIVPRSIAESFVARCSADDVRICAVDGASHVQGWVQQWKALCKEFYTSF